MPTFSKPPRFLTGFFLWLCCPISSFSAPANITFTRHIAPIFFAHCSVCHRPGQAAPFPLLTYEDAKKHAREIAEVTGSRYMPPWLPAPGPEKFANERGLSAAQIALIDQWVREGAREGDPVALPKPPPWPEGWQLGKPDLVVEMPESYTLRADGPDLYRNFVIPVPVETTRYVKAFEFQPGNPKIVHHAVIQIDRTPAARSLDARDAEPGFSGFMSSPSVQLADGQFLGWTPGKAPSPPRDGMAWRLGPGTDLVLQLHLRPSGKPEPIKSSIALYFAEKPPSVTPYPLVLRNKAIDIPAGQSSYPISQVYRVPVDLDVLSIYPHAHYLAREMKVAVTLPTGEKRDLIRILRWNFNWQEEYRFLTPIFLPAGTEVRFDYTYDNSAENPRNPSAPPKRVRYGRNSTDEMGELLLETIPKKPAELGLLRQYSARQELRNEVQLHETRLRENPDNLQEHLYLGARYLELGDLDRATGHFARAAQLDPGSAEGRYSFGDALARAGRFEEALDHLETAVRLAPENPVYLTALAKVLSIHPNPARRDPAQAVKLATRAAELTAYGDIPVLDGLAIAWAAAGRFDQAISTTEKAIKLAGEQQQAEMVTSLRRKLDGYKAARAQQK